jgi:acyl carrier protein
MTESLEGELRSFVVENFLFGDASRAPARDDSFLELGIIDSTGVLELVAFVEQRFGFKVLDAELLPENLDSLAALTAFIGRKTTAKAVQP